MLNVLMLSSSRAGNEDYLAHAKPMICEHLAGITSALFISYAGVTMSGKEYTKRVQDALPDLSITGISEYPDPKQAIENAQAILVGGGNTFHLLYQLYQFELLSLIRERVANGVPYVGWSAGSNICGQSIRTTNDMPIIEPPSFTALNFIPTQINPHYTDYQPPNHNGETRDQRLQEFTTIHPNTPIIAIREGTALELKNRRLTLKGQLNGFVFKGTEKTPISANDDLSYLLT